MLPIIWPVLRFIIPLLFVGIWHSCRENSEPDDLINIYVNNPDEFKGIVKMSDLCSDFRIIPLETLPDNYTGSIGEVKIADSIIFIFNRQLKAIDLYAFDGKFIRRIRNTGRGPGEYMQPAGFHIIPERKEVLIYDWNNRKISSYSYLTGKYLRDVATTPEGKPFHNFAFERNHFIFISCSSPDPNDAFFIWSRDTLNNSVRKFVPTLAGESNRRLNIPYTQYGNFSSSENSTIKVFWPYSNVIYQVSGERIMPYARLVSEGLTATDSDYLNLINGQIPTHLAEMKISKIFGVTSYSENEHLAFIVFKFEFRPYFLLYSFKSGESITFGIQNLTNDFLEMKGANFLGIYGNKLVTFISPQSVDALLVNLQNGKVKVTQEENLRLDSLIRHNVMKGEGSSNPILVFYELKY